MFLISFSRALHLMLILTAANPALCQRLECPTSVHGQAARMISSNLDRGQGSKASNASTGQIELGLFHQALREAISWSNDTDQADGWRAVLRDSVLSANASLSNSTIDTALPLDRLSIGTAALHQFQETGDQVWRGMIQALQQSVADQKRNDNGGLWYYANPLNLTAYQNLSYLDGMFSYAPFVILSAKSDLTSDTKNLNEAAAWEQLAVLRKLTKRSDGLSVHGYDAIKNHTWADPTTGASPVVWGRAQAWYTLGLVNSLELLQNTYSDLMGNFQDLYVDMIEAQIAASELSLQTAGRYGVWQVVDKPGAVFDGTPNFVEASSTLMTVYSLLKGVRLGLFEDKSLEERATRAGLGMFDNIQDIYLLDNGNGTLSLNGTSAVSTLSGNVDYKVGTLVLQLELELILPIVLCHTTAGTQ
jgi:rhamnogalacturonyl hydrolase YesR